MIAKIWKQPKHPKNEELAKLCHILPHHKIAKIYSELYYRTIIYYVKISQGMLRLSNVYG